MLQLSRSLLVAKQLLDIVQTLDNRKLLKSSVSTLFEGYNEKKVRSKLIASMTRCLTGYGFLSVASEFADLNSLNLT